ncbi:MAG: nucleotidyltransferase family protein [Limisphaera sp.]
MRTCGILLAAGRARRMGQPKLLLPWGHSTVLATVADAFLGAGLDPVLVVVGPGSEALRAALTGRPVRFVENPDPEGEMLRSVRCGLSAAPKDADAFAVSPADLPGLTAELIRGLLTGHERLGGKITVPVWQGRRGHPLIFAAELRAEVLSRFDGVGLRGLLEAHAAEVREWPAPDASPLLDLDTPEDYARGLARWKTARAGGDPR